MNGYLFRYPGLFLSGETFVVAGTKAKALRLFTEKHPNVDMERVQIETFKLESGLVIEIDNGDY